MLSGDLQQRSIQRTDPLKRVTGGDGRREVQVSSDGKSADTRFDSVATGDSASLVRATIGTGRTHQIRVHAQAMGHPLLGDDKYFDAASRERSRALGVRHMLLHSYRLDLPEAAIGVTAPLPPDWLALLNAVLPDQSWQAQIQFQ